MKSLTRGKKNQAVKLLGENQVLEAKALFERVCQNDRKDVESWIYLVKINAQLGDSAAVEKCCRAIIGLRPDLHEAHLNLGTALLLSGKLGDAAESLRNALKLQPDNPTTLFQLGKAFHLQAQFDDALTNYKRALAIAPAVAEIYDSIGSILKYRGDLDGAIENYRRALHAKPDFAKAHSDLIFAMNYSPRYSASAIFHEHARWGQTHRLPPVISPGLTRDLDPTRRLRVGYVSPDFCKHAVAFFFEPLLANHDREAIETFCYSDVAKPDQFTGRLQQSAAQWRNIRGMGDHQVAGQIRRDGIDILVDLTGHTANSRLLAFTARPAPVQVSYLGYPNTTGVPAIDYRLTDEWADPPGVTDEFHTEKLVRLPLGFLCYLPADHAPAVAPLPALSGSQVVFGSFNNLAKITPEVVALWAQVLRAVPASRLIVKNLSLRDAPTRDRYLQMFEAHGVNTTHIDLHPPIYSNEEHLELYGKVDIGLDSFPYNGTTTTCEATWMGVPTITLAGSMHAGRVGVSLLTRLGLEEFIGESPEDYVRIAVDVAADLDRLATLRAGLRERMAHSSLCDGKAFARQVESAYRDMWNAYCAKNQKG